MSQLVQLQEPCILCGARQAKLYHRPIGLLAQLGADVVKCQQCGLVFLNPMPAEEYLHEFYLHYHRFGNAWFSADRPGYEATTIGKKHRLNYQLIRDNYTFSGNRALDIGCGRGVFLDILKRDGWNVLGVEYSEDAVHMAHEQFGVDALLGNFETIELPDERFDLITFWDVLEHMRTPRGALARCRSLLKEDGLIVIETPNMDSLLNVSADWSYRAGWKWPASLLYGPHHLYYFDPVTLGHLLERTGFCISQLSKTEEDPGRQTALGWGVRLATTALFLVARTLRWQHRMVVHAKPHPTP